MRCCPQCHRVWREAHDYCPADGTPLVLVREDDDPLVGLVLDERYRLLSLLGTGGMGFVYRAEQIGLGRRVAVKMLFAERTRDRTSVKRFQREARALATLDHPGIVRVFDYGDLDGRTPYLVMEEAHGPPLDTVLHGHGRLPPRLAVGLGAQIAEAVAAAHRAGIVHRDLKPANVHLVAEEAGVAARILDFGLAQLVATDEDMLPAETRLTRKGTIFGTPEYMAPEQVRGGGADQRTDVYALGIVVFEMLTGAPPFTAGSASQVLAQQMEAPPPPLALPGVDEALVGRVRRLLEALLAKKPEDRPSPAGAVARQLRALEAELPDPGPVTRFLADARARARADDVTSRLDAGPDREGADPFAGVATAADADRALEAALAGARRAGRVRLALGLVGLGLVSAFATPLVVAWSRGAFDAAPSLRVVETGPMLTVASTPDDGPPGAAQLPGGEVQARYELSLRALQVELAARGLAPDDLRVLPQARALWLTQSEAARDYRFADADAALAQLRELAAALETEVVLARRLDELERRGGADAAQLEALRAALPAAAAVAGETRAFLERVRAAERGEAPR